MSLLYSLTGNPENLKDYIKKAKRKRVEVDVEINMNFAPFQHGNYSLSWGAEISLYPHLSGHVSLYYDNGFPVKYIPSRQLIRWKNRKELKELVLKVVAECKENGLEEVLQIARTIHRNNIRTTVHGIPVDREDEVRKRVNDIYTKKRSEQLINDWFNDCDRPRDNSPDDSYLSAPCAMMMGIS
jgi:hypothetical protein